MTNPSRRSFLGRCLAGAVLAAARWLPVPEPPTISDLRSYREMTMMDLFTMEAMEILRDMYPRRR